jgi:hypothetical protein
MLPAKQTHQALAHIFLVVFLNAGVAVACFIFFFNVLL